MTYLAHLDMHNCTLRRNSASVQGGALMSATDMATVSNCTFEDNHALQGGAVLLQPPFATEMTNWLEGCSFINNR